MHNLGNITLIIIFKLGIWITGELKFNMVIMCQT